jgi:hypothetical protein
MEQPAVKIDASRQVNEKIRRQSQCSYQLMEQSEVRVRPTRTPGNTRGGIRCLGWVSFPCQPVTSAMSPKSTSGKLYEPQSRLVYQEQLNEWYKTHQTYFDHSLSTCHVTRKSMEAIYSLRTEELFQTFPVIFLQSPQYKEFFRFNFVLLLPLLSYLVCITQ